jgi:hypothetical protein
MSLSAEPTDITPIPEDQVAIGEFPLASTWTKFGQRYGLTAGAGEETIWQTTGNFAVQTTADTYTITYNNTTDGSGSTGALVLLIDYLDSNFEMQQATHVLSNTGSDVTSFSGVGINRVVVVASGTNDANGSDITLADTAATFGTQAVLPANQSVTQQAIFHMPINHTAIAKFLWVNCLKISGGSSPRVTVTGYVYNRLVDTRYDIFECDIDTSVQNFVNIVEPVGFKLGGRDVLYFVANTDTNNTDIKLRFSLVDYAVASA